MLKIENSIANLRWTTDHHYQHIQNQHPFMRAWAIQFELAYTDFRVIQLALQLDGQAVLLADFAKTYEQIHAFEYEFAANGLEGFNAKFADQMANYATEVEHLGRLLDQISDLQA